MSAADLAHRPMGPNEVHLADLVAGPFGADAAFDLGGDVFVGCTRAQQGPQIKLVDCEQAVAQLAFGSQPNPVAVAAERLGDAGENIVNESIATKVFASEAAARVIDVAIQLVGGQALREGHPLAALYNEVRVYQLTEGASDVLRLNLARGRLELDKGRI